MPKKFKFDKVLADKLMLRAKRWEQECVRLKSNNQQLTNIIQVLELRVKRLAAGAVAMHDLQKAVATFKKLFREIP